MQEHEKLDRSFQLFWNLDLDDLREEMEDSEETTQALRQLEDMVTEFDDVHYDIMQQITGTGREVAKGDRDE